ncbi:13917_t:CDS:1, partial [Gigaspora margarita]
AVLNNILISLKLALEQMSAAERNSESEYLDFYCSGFTLDEL